MNQNIQQTEHQIQSVGEVCNNRDNCISVGFSHPAFPVRSQGDGTPVAYSQFMALAKIATEDLTKDACLLSVSHDFMRVLSTLATLRCTTEHQGGDSFLLPATRKGLFEFAVETTTRNRDVNKHPINRSRFVTLDDATIRPVLSTQMTHN